MHWSILWEYIILFYFLINISRFLFLYVFVCLFRSFQKWMQNNRSDKKVLKSLIREFFGKRLYWYVLRSNKLDISILCDVAQPEWDGDPSQGYPPTYQQVTLTTNHLIQVCNKQARTGLNLPLILCYLTILTYIFRA